MADPARWQRLADSLTAAGVPDVKITQFGESHYIGWRLANGWLVEVHDKWWSKNIDKWIGWQVDIQGRDDFIKRTWPLTKKRGEVVAAVIEARKMETK